MLVQPTLQKLEGIGLTAMAAALREQLDHPGPYQGLSFEDRFGLLVDREADWRTSRRLQTRLKAARLRYPLASVEDIDFRAPRGLDRATILSLAQADWVERHQNLIVTGATGCGKSFLACALAQAAIRQELGALYLRVPRLLETSPSAGRTVATPVAWANCNESLCWCSMTSCSPPPRSSNVVICWRSSRTARSSAPP